MQKYVFDQWARMPTRVSPGSGPPSHPSASRPAGPRPVRLLLRPSPLLLWPV